VLFFVLLTHLIEGVTQKTSELLEFIFIKFSTFEDRNRNGKYFNNNDNAELVFQHS